MLKNGGNKGFVYYEDMDVLINKIDYYLLHDDEIHEMENNGYQNVRSNHTIRLRLNRILETIY